MSKIYVFDYDKVHGLVNYGSMDSEFNGGYAAKMGCKACGAAWLDVNHLDGHHTCPQCGASGRKIIAVE